MWIYTGNKLAKFHGNILSLSENIAKSFRGGLLFLTHTVHVKVSQDIMLITCVISTNYLKLSVYFAQRMIPIRSESEARINIF